MESETRRTQRVTNASIWSYANPRRTMALTGALAPWLIAASAFALVVGAAWSLSTPPDRLHGARVWIMFVHVPAATLGVSAYLAMALASAIGLLRGHPVSHLAAKAAAPLGAAFTLTAILTGMIWGQPGWGSSWEWDAQLTSVLILLLFYLGYLALWAAVDDPDRAAPLAAVLCLFGSVFALAARFAVLLFETQHQGATLTVAQFDPDAAPNIHNVYFYPLLWMIGAHYLLFAALLCVNLRTEIRLRRIRALRLTLG